ncbi:hypothetical protein [Phenylobacterium sp.]|jgi:hypothetical protein|uniref:hypothetical protein n=1 Tax=Phenylobacterium sp. TaxID=1871053 RepID=UPI003784C283
MSDDSINSEGRKANAALPLDAAKDNAGAERYPSVRQDDGVEGSGETRSFDPPKNPNPPQGAGDGPISANEGRLGPGADPAEGKR